MALFSADKDTKSQVQLAYKALISSRVLHERDIESRQQMRKQKDGKRV